jgi:hypothetical protein
VVAGHPYFRQGATLLTGLGVVEPIPWPMGVVRSPHGRKNKNIKKKKKINVLTPHGQPPSSFSFSFLSF